MTVKEFKSYFKTTLKDKYPIDEIDNFYYLLLAHYLDLKRVDIALEPNQLIQEETLGRLIIALKKLSQEIPIQYIIGNTEFYGLPFKVDENVLIPRPETEELVSWIVASTCFDSISTTLNVNAQQPPLNEQKTILDIGTGSGCIAIALAKNLPNAKVFALDISENALKIAKQNAELNKVKIQFIQQDILTSTPLSQQFDIIVSNPPYVRNLEKKEINKNVLENEPHLALFVDNNNPLLFYDKIADLAKRHLKPNGQLFFEINQYLGKETFELLKNIGFKNIELQKDIFKNDRMIKATL